MQRHCSVGPGESRSNVNMGSVEAGEEEPSEEEPYEEEPSEEEPYEEEPSEVEPFEGQPYEEEPSEEEPFEEQPYEEEPSEEEPFEEEPYEEEPREEEPFESKVYAQSCNSDSNDDSVQPNAWKTNMPTDIMADRKRASGSHGTNLLEKSHNQSSKLVVSEKAGTARITRKRNQSRWNMPGNPGPTEDCAHEAAKKRITTCSNDESRSKMPGVLKLPDFLFDPDFQKLHVQANEITKKLLAREIVDDRPEDERSPSPPPGYECSREAKLREKLMMQRQSILSELVHKFPGFKPPLDYKKPKLHKKIYVPVKEYPGYNFIGPLLGPQANTLKRMQIETGARIRIRGKGFVRRDQLYNPDPSDNEDLHVIIEAESQVSLDAAADMVEKLLIPVEEEFNVHKHAQLRELAKQYVKLKENNSINDPNHPTSVFPLASSTLGANMNDQVSFPDNQGNGLSLSSSSMPSGTSMLPMANPVCNNMKPQKAIDYSNLYICYLPQSVDENKLIELFAPFGEICQVRVQRDRTTGISKGFGFVKYTNHVNAATAIANMNGYQIDGHILSVRVAGMFPSANSNTGHLSYNQPQNHTNPAYTAQYDPGAMYWPNYPGYMLPVPMSWQGPQGCIGPQPDASYFMGNIVSMNGDPFNGPLSGSINTSYYASPSPMLYGFPAPNEATQFSGYSVAVGPQPQLDHESMKLTSSSSSQVPSVQTLCSSPMPPPSVSAGYPEGGCQGAAI